MGGFTPREFFEIEDPGDREPVAISFSDNNAAAPGSRGARRSGRARGDTAAGRAAARRAPARRLERAQGARRSRSAQHPRDSEAVRRAFDLATLVHRGQLRTDGEPYVAHPVEVSRLLAELGADEITRRRRAASRRRRGLRADGRRRSAARFGDEVADDRRRADRGRATSTTGSSARTHCARRSSVAGRARGLGLRRRQALEPA